MGVIKKRTCTYTSGGNVHIFKTEKICLVGFETLILKKKKGILESIRQTFN